RCKLRGDIPSFPVSLTTSWHVGLSYIIPNRRPTRSAGTQCDNSNSRFSHALLDISNSIEWASGSLMSSKSASNSKKFSSVSNITSRYLSENKSTKEIAARLGYKNTSAFSRAMKRWSKLAGD
ncbi:hypothetical protein ABZO35_28965, partial [Burkholderia pseudomallei]